MFDCKICNAPDNDKRFYAKEMMFGTLEEFEYFECSICGCLQLLNPPQNMNKYYPEGYYSLSENLFRISGRHIKDLLLKEMARWKLWNKGLVGRFIPQKYCDKTLSLLKKCNIGIDSRILDVGSGSGRLLYMLHLLGFKNLKGVDPHIEEDIKDKDDKVIIRKGSVNDLKGDFDLIMFNHSLEHMDDHTRVIEKVGNLLKPNGKCLIRIPIAQSRAHKWYGPNWANLDAPRHLILHSKKSIQLLAQKANLRLEHISYDSHGFQFEGSELYMRGAPLFVKGKYGKYIRQKVFKDSEMKAFEVFSSFLNEMKEGDQAAFIFQKTRPENINTLK